MRTALALVLIAAPALAQDVVRLKNGRLLAGEITMSDADPDAFTLKLWETGGEVRIRWDQLGDDEERRLKNEEEVPSVEMIPALVVTTENGDYYRGVVDREEKGILYLKERGKTSPTPIIASKIVTREEKPLPETDLYTPAEILGRRAAGADPTDPDAVIALAQYAVTWKLWAEAADYYFKAADALEKRSAADPRVAEWRAATEEMNARVKLAEINDYVDQTDFDNALTLAQELIERYAATPTGVANADLVAQIQAQRDEFLANRDQVMLERVADAWPKERGKRINEIVSDAKKDFDLARTRADGLDAAVAAVLAEKFKASDQEINDWWLRREEIVDADPKKKLKRYEPGFGQGTWIVRGGRDGGTDFIEFADAQGNNPQQPNNPRGPNNPNQGTAAYGKPLETSGDWWGRQSATVKKQWLEAYYAERSQMVVVEELVNEKPCAACGGTGQKTQTREGRKCRVICPTCHGHTGRDEKMRIVEQAVKYY